MINNLTYRQNKPLNPSITYQEVNKDFDILKKHAYLNEHLIFKDLTDYELFLNSIIDTCNFGRSFKDSVKNALGHLESNESKEQYIKLHTTKDKEECLI